MPNMDDTIPSEPIDEGTIRHEPVLDDAREVASGEPTAQQTESVSREMPPSASGSTATPSASTGVFRLILLGMAGLGALMLVVGAVLAALLLGGGGETLTPDNPTASHPDGISISLVGEGRLRVRLASIPRETFLNRAAGPEYSRARDAIPPYLQMKSPLYTLGSRGDGESLVQIVIPNEAQPYETLDLYTWDQEADRWVFVPGHVDLAGQVIQTDQRPDNLAVFQSGAVIPLIGTTVEAQQIMVDEAASTLNMVFPTGLNVRPDGALEGSLFGGWRLGAGYAVVPVIHAEDSAALSALLNNEATLALHVQDISSFVISDGYDGVALDYQNIDPADREAFTAFVRQLSDTLGPYNKRVVVFLPRPAGGPDVWDTGGYDWRGLGEVADAVVIWASNNPADYAPGGNALALLRWAVGEINRLKIHLATSSLSVREDAGVLSTISFDEALAPLGTVIVDTTVPEGADSYLPGTALEFSLSGAVSEVQQDPTTGAYGYALDEGAHIWIVTASAVRARLNLANTFHIGGIVVVDLLDSGNDIGVLAAVNEFKAGSASTLPNQLFLEWTVVGASGAAQTQSTGIGTPLRWQADEPGDYTIQADIIGGRNSPRGSVSVRVAEAATEQVPTPTATRSPTGGNTNNNAPPAPTQSSSPPPSAGGAGNPGGGFELGGQVPNSLGVIGYMQAAGMTWVKFQAKWPYVDAATACSYVASGHAAGLKVLLSIPGPLYPTSIDFGSYTEHLRSVASCQPDAIEVWNEMNLDREWPAGQIDPANYVNNMLAPGFNAIKQQSPGTMVIIGALAPTGFDNGTNAWSDQRYLQGLAAAGAANYANCVGAHHNSGTTSPSVRSGRSEGDHYSWYFLPTLEVTYFSFGSLLPVCVTEFGYVSPEGYGPLPSNFSWGADNTVAEQAAWLKEGADISRRLGWVRLMIIFNVGFTTWTENDPQAGYSIVRPDGSCPACDLLP